jgi:hypothetical protein
MQQRIIDYGNQESLETYLLLYVGTQEHCQLPGRDSTGLMAYQEYATGNSGGEQAVKGKKKQITSILAQAHSSAANKANYLSQLKPFYGIHIWDKIISPLRNTEQFEQRRQKILDQMDTITDALQSDEMTQTTHDAKMHALNQEYQALEQDQLGTAGEDRRITRLLNHIRQPSGAA